MRNTLFRTVATSLAALTIGVSLATTPVLAASRHGGGGGSHHVLRGRQCSASGPFHFQSAPRPCPPNEPRAFGTFWKSWRGTPSSFDALQCCSPINTIALTRLLEAKNFSAALISKDLSKSGPI
jgi:hypothetical protein